MLNINPTEAAVDETNGASDASSSGIAADEAAFLQTYRRLDWATEPPETYVRFVRLALAYGAYRMAQELAAKGAQRFRNEAELQKMAAILAPTVVRRSGLAAEPGLIANRDWLQNHRENYRGRWVALRNGVLLGESETVEQLVKLVGDVRNKPILITRVY